MTLKVWVRDFKKTKVLQHCVNNLQRYVMNYRKKKNEMRKKEHDEEQDRKSTSEIKVCEKRHKKCIKESIHAIFQRD